MLNLATPEQVHASVLAARDHAEPIYLNSIFCAISCADEIRGTVHVTHHEVKWRPHITRRNDFKMVHLVLTPFPAMLDGRVTRAEVRKAVRGSTISGALFEALLPLRHGWGFPGNYYMVWNVGTVVFEDEPVLQDEDWEQPARIDAPLVDDPVYG